MARIIGQFEYDGYLWRRETESDFTVTVDGVGPDPGTSVVMYNQTTATALGSFATIRAALAALPDNIRHDVTISLSDGYHALDFLSIREFSRFVFGYDKQGSAFTAVGGNIIFTSTSGLVAEVGTTALGVTSSSGLAGSHVVTLDADPGYADNIYQDYMLYVTSGTGAGSFKPIRSHSGDSFGVAGAFSPALDNSSVVEIRRPAAGLEVQDDFPTIKMTNAKQLDYGIILDAVDFVNVSAVSGITFEDGTLRMTNGARSLNILFVFSNSIFTHETCVISKDSAGGFALLSFQDNGLMRTSIGNSAPLLLRCSTTGYLCNFNSVSGPTMCFLFGGQQFDGGTTAAIRADGGLVSLVLDRSGGTSLVTNGAASYALDAVDGASIQITSGTLAGLDSTFVGSVEDIRIDGIGLDWATVDADPDNSVLGPKGTRIFEET